MGGKLRGDHCLTQNSMGYVSFKHTKRGQNRLLLKSIEYFFPRVFFPQEVVLFETLSDTMRMFGSELTKNDFERIDYVKLILAKSVLKVK